MIALFPVLTSSVKFFFLIFSGQQHLWLEDCREAEPRCKYNWLLALWRHDCAWNDQCDHNLNINVFFFFNIWLKVKLRYLYNTLIIMGVQFKPGYVCGLSGSVYCRGIYWKHHPNGNIFYWYSLNVKEVIDIYIRNMQKYICIGLTTATENCNTMKLKPPDLTNLSFPNSLPNKRVWNQYVFSETDSD